VFQTKHIAYKFKLRPTPEQRLALAQAAGCCRWIYNWGLQNRIAVYEAVKDLPKKERNAALNVSANSSQELQVSILRSQFPFLRSPIVRIFAYQLLRPPKNRNTPAYSG
jgi:transposase